MLAGIVHLRQYQTCNVAQVINHNFSSTNLCYVGWQVEVVAGAEKLIRKEEGRNRCI